MRFREPARVAERWQEGYSEGMSEDLALDPEITVQAFAQLREDAAANGEDVPVLLDVREPWEYQTARFEDSVLMPMGDVPSRAHAELDPDAHIVVMCHHGQRSLSVAMWLRGQGFERAQSLAGGIDAWSRTVDANVPRY
jgi:rhodanese-related sulfurtransferase